MKRVTAVCALLLFLLPVGARGEEKGSSGEELFSLANLAFVDGRHDEAVSGYRKMLEKGIVNPDVYYNLGNALLKTGKTGEALLYYEKSMELSGESEDLAHNMKLAREILTLPEEPEGAASPFEKTGQIISFKGAADLFHLFYGLAFLALLAGLLSADEGIGKKLKQGAAFFALLAFISGTLTLYKLRGQEAAEYAIVVVKKAGLNEVPLDKDTPVIFLREGMKVRVSEVDTDWLKVSVPGGNAGWIKRTAAEII